MNKTTHRFTKGLHLLVIAALLVLASSLSLQAVQAEGCVPYSSFINKTTAHGLGNNNVWGVYASGSTVYAATDSGLSISTDGGNTFTNKKKADGLGSSLVWGVYASGSTVYAATAGGLSIGACLDLTVNMAGSGTGTVTSDPAGTHCSADCTEVYNIDTVVTLTAYPGVKSYFVGWSGDCDGTGITTQVTMDADKTCTATFGYPVGGIVVPANKLGLLAPWMGMVALVSLAAFTVVLVRRSKP